jgi:hypothetical protein
VPANGVVLVRGARPPRRWPSVVVTVLVVFSLSLTGFLFFRDHQNAEAATASRSNAPQDALAMAALSRLAQTLDLDASVRVAGVVGIQAIGLHDFQKLVVGPLGGSVERGAQQWTIALDGGWGCLEWLQGRGHEGMAEASLGVCTDNAPLLSSQGVTAVQFIRAEDLVATRERAAIDAADAAAAIASTVPGYEVRFALPSLSVRFARLDDTGFRAWTTATGITVAAAASSACLQPTATEEQVRVTLGPCA